MISAFQAFLCLAAVAGAAWAFGPHGARRCIAVLATNWALCCAFVSLTGNFTPWAWFWTMDLFSAAAITIPPISKWQKGIAALYMFQFGFHAGYGIFGGGQMRYLTGLDALFLMQLLIITIWTTGHGLYRFRCAHPHRASRLDTVLGWTAR